MSSKDVRKLRIEVGKLEEKVALHGSATCELAFDGSRAVLLGEDGKGFQHMLNGYTLSVQKALTAQASADDTEQTRMTISSGDTAGRVNLGALLLTQPNLQLSPVFSGSGHDQCTWAVVDGINLPCQPDDGSICIDSIGFDGPATTPTNTTNHINGWAVNLWGRTITTKFTPRENKGA